MTENYKIQRNLIFYFWMGVVLYALNNIMNVIDFYQRYAWDVWGYVGFVMYFGFNLFLIYKIRARRNWARNLFMAKLKHYITDDTYRSYRARYKECIRMLNGLEKSIEKHLPEKDRRWEVAEATAEYGGDAREFVPPGWPISPNTEH